MSIVYVDHGAEARFRDVCGDVLRDSDELVEFDSTSILLMGETDSKGALQAVTRFKKRCGDSLGMRYALAAYPGDGSSADDLLAVVHSRLEAVRTREGGAVVAF
jgi:hypothetical protein